LADHSVLVLNRKENAKVAKERKVRKSNAIAHATQQPPSFAAALNEPLSFGAFAKRCAFCVISSV
jgi:hypothetical protein